MIEQKKHRMLMQKVSVRESYYTFCIERKHAEFFKGMKKTKMKHLAKWMDLKINVMKWFVMKWKNVGKNILEVSMGMIKKLKWMLVVKTMLKSKRMRFRKRIEMNIMLILNKNIEK